MSNLFSSLHHYDPCHIHNLFWLLYSHTQTPCYYADLRILHNIHVVVAEGASCRSELCNPANRIFLHGDGINVLNKMSTNELNPCGYTRYFSFANALTVKLFFLISYFPVFWYHYHISSIVFWDSIPYGKIIPLYLNRVVRLTPMHIIIIAKIDSWTLGESPCMQSWPTSACVKSCFTKWRLRNGATIWSFFHGWK